MNRQPFAFALAVAIVVVVAATAGATTVPRDKVPPTKPTIDVSGLPGTLRPAFVFGSRDNRTPPSQIRFRCAIDGAQRRPCSRDYQPVSDLVFGKHSIQVVAVDRADNRSRVSELPFTIVGTWDAAADFPWKAPSENPGHDQYGNTVWWYLHSDAAVHDASLYSPLPHFDAENAQWNIAGSGASIVTPLVGVSGNSVVFHPGYESYAILGWRSPYTGTVRLAFTVRLIDPGAQNGGNGIAWSIDRGNTIMQSQVLFFGTNEQAAITTDVTAGDQFYVTIDNRGDSNWDTTTGEFVVTTVFN
jgi:hypothetical protein